MRTLSEEYLLIAWDDQTGRPRVDSTHLSGGLAGAVLLQLVLDGYLAINEANPKKPVLSRTQVTCTDPLLLQVIDLADGRTPKAAVSRVAGFTTFRNRMSDLKAAMFERLERDGVLERGRRRFAGIFPVTTYLPKDPRIEAEIRQRLDAALLGIQEPEERTAALISLLSASALLERGYPREQRKAVQARAKEISAGDWASQAVRQAVDEVVSAVIAATTAATVAASS
ncbi:GOLPH3/VPS74 family protein [Kribbia dieselivorans]|uniref:GOLPH3/VPS74 family protein n=1 Tax=Kribbia dieselivorans TaxID=331526 RepID=UPI0008388DEB|nr:GPP34 family phosphoprotein [Kribbia dieselivorans]